MPQSWNNIVDYCSPDFYHFSEDPVWAAKEIVAREKGKKTAKFLDLCAGQGILGLEILQGIHQIEEAHFVELQEEFRPYWEKNYQLFGCSHRAKMVFQVRHFQDLCPPDHHGYDLIASNPPYFAAHAHRQGPSRQRQLCRSWPAEYWPLFWDKLMQLLSPQGRAYFLSLEEQLPRLKDWQERYSHSELTPVAQKGKVGLYLLNILDV
jgi:tRNA1Val (adenine37-N6)-methyltransferase